MRTPKTFIPKKDDKKLGRILSKKQAYTIENLLSSCEEFSRKLEEGFNGYHPVTWYEDLGMVLAKGISYKKNDLEELSMRIVINKEQERNLGCYLSALVNKIIKEKETITLSLGARIDYLGIKLPRGTLIVRGGIGDHLGYGMEAGKIIAEGNTGSHVGHRMEDGEIIIKGNSKSHLGSYMFGGKILVEGNVGDFLAMVMHEGEIVVNGDVVGKYPCYSMKKSAKVMVNGILRCNYFSYCEGEIYHKGVKVWPK